MRLREIAMLLGALAMVASSAHAQQQDCLRVDSAPPGVTLSIGGESSFSASAPGLFCSLVPGRTYTLSASMPSYESRMSKLRIREDGRASFSGNWRGHLASSMLLPGWGQSSLGHPGRSAEAMIVFGLGAARTWMAWERYDRENSAADGWSELYNQSTDERQRAGYFDLAEISRGNAAALRDNLYYTGGFAGLWYLGNLYEVYTLAAPLGTKELEDGTIEIRLPRRSKKRAAFRSFFWPGTGQKYNGNRGKSFLFQWSFVMLSHYALDKKLLFDLADVEYEFWNEKFNTATSVPEKESLRLQTAVRWDRREVLRREMYKFAAAAGAVWVVNFVDAVVFGGTPELPNRLNVETSFDSNTMRTGFSVAF